MSGPYPPHANPYALAAHALDTLLVPARRASILMFVYGGLGGVMGGCILLSAAVVSSHELSSQPQVLQMMAESGITVSQLRVIFTVAGIAVLLGGVALAALGLVVRRGALAWVLLATLLTGGLMLLMLLFIAVSLVGGQPAAVCVYGLPLAMLAVLLVFLVQALTRTGLVAQWQAYQQAVTGQATANPAVGPLGYAPPPPPAGGQR